MYLLLFLGAFFGYGFYLVRQEDRDLAVAQAKQEQKNRLVTVNLLPGSYAGSLPSRAEIAGNHALLKAMTLTRGEQLATEHHAGVTWQEQLRRLDMILHERAVEAGQLKAAKTRQTKDMWKPLDKPEGLPNPL